MNDLCDFRRLYESLHHEGAITDIFDDVNDGLIIFYQYIELEHNGMFLSNNKKIYTKYKYKNEKSSAFRCFMISIYFMLIRPYNFSPHWFDTYKKVILREITEEDTAEGICVIPAQYNNDEKTWGGFGSFCTYLNPECLSMKFFKALTTKDKINPYNTHYIDTIVKNMNLSDIKFIILYYTLLFEYFEFAIDKFDKIFNVIKNNKNDEVLKLCLKYKYFHLLFIYETDNILNLAKEIYKIWKNTKDDCKDELMLYTMVLILSPYFIINNNKNELHIYAPFLFKVK